MCFYFDTSSFDYSLSIVSKGNSILHSLKLNPPFVSLIRIYTYTHTYIGFQLFLSLYKDD